MTEEILTIEHLTKRFGDMTVLEDLNLTVRQREVIVIVGPSGCGKSTLLRCINALEEIQEGEIRLDGQRISGNSGDLAELRRKIGMVFQSYDLFPHLNVLDNITLAPRKVLKTPAAEAEAEARSLLKRVGLEEKAEDRNSGSPSSVPCACILRSFCLTKSRRRWIRKWSGRCWK